MVTTMSWTTKYMNRLEFMAHFHVEQDYVDAMFVQMILFNYGVWLDVDSLYQDN